MPTHECSLGYYPQWPSYLISLESHINTHLIPTLYQTLCYWQRNSSQDHESSLVAKIINNRVHSVDKSMLPREPVHGEIISARKPCLTWDVKFLCVGENLRQWDQHVQGTRGQERGPNIGLVTQWPHQGGDTFALQLKNSNGTLNGFQFFLLH